METARLECACPLATLSWNNEGNRLLTAGEYIQLWHSRSAEDDEDGEAVTFQVGPVSSSGSGGGGNDDGGDAPAAAVGWTCLWKTRPANPVVHLAYSPDGTLFATAGKHDRLVRVWYQNQQRKFS